MSNFKPQPTEIHMEAVPDGDNLIQFPASAEEYAVGHALQGKAVFPVSTRGDYMPKRDGIDGTGGFRRASVDPATVRALYREFAKTYGYECDGVGWALPEGIVALDCDEKPTPSGVERHGWTVDWPKLIDFRDEIPATLTATTKSAGKHLVFRIPLGLSLDQSEFQRTAPGIDLKGNLTGLIKIEGTPGYRFDNANEIADCPAWLLPMITKPKAVRETATVAATKASNFQVSARMQEWVNRAVRRAKENLAVPRNTAAVWGAQQMRDDLAGMGYDYREEIEPWCEKLRIRLSALKDHEYEDEKMRKVIAGLGEPRPPAENPEKAAESKSTPSWLTPAQVLREAAGNAEKFPTGFETLDRFTKGGIRSGDLVIIKGPTEAGKTTLAVQIAQTWAKRKDVLVVGIFDDEGRKAAAVRIGQGSFGIERDRLEAGEEDAVRALETLGERIFLPDPDAEDFETIAEEAARRANGRSVVLIIDSLQTVRTAEPVESERLGIKALVNAARSFNARHGFRTIALSEVNRGAYAARAEKDRVSKLSSGAGSSRIEYGCELLIDIESATTVEVLKNRIGGKKGRFTVELDEDTVLFSEVPTDEAQRRADHVRRLEEDAKVGGAINRIVEALRSCGKTAPNTRTLRSLVKGSREAFDVALIKAESAGKVCRRHGQGKGNPVEWTLPE